MAYITLRYIIIGDCAFHIVAYNIYKTKPYIFNMFYTIINKYINNYYLKEIIIYFFN